MYSYTCCGNALVTHAYHPGERIAVDWIRVASHGSKKPPTAITLIVSASGPYASVAILKHAFAMAHPNYGPTNFEAAPIKLSDTRAARPVSSLRVPANAGPGFYNLTEIVQEGLHFSSSASVVKIRP
jgi:hypothetical protein